MFWGLIMEPQKRYSQTVHKSFHISMAALDLCSCTDEPVQVMCGFENRKYLLCTLQKDKILQVPLDVNFEVGDQISFITNGESHVHLTGYLNEDFSLDEEAEEEEEDDDELDLSQSNIVSGKRAKKMCSNPLQPPAKKSKTMQLLDSVNSQEDDDSDDSDVNLSDILDDEEDDDEDESNLQLDEDDDDEEGEEEAEEADDDEEDDEEEEDDDDEVEEEEEDEEEEDVKPKMNGTAKDAKKNKVVEAVSKKQQAKNQQQKQQQQDKKGDKKQKEGSQKKKIEGGVIIEDIRVGNGKIAQKGKTVQVYYEGRLSNSNKVFDSTTKGAGFKFRLGKQEVIKAWDAGVAGMKIGGKRRIVCPPHMAYGAKGSPPVIPPNSTLVFDVELKNVH